MWNTHRGRIVVASLVAVLSTSFWGCATRNAGHHPVKTQSATMAEVRVPAEISSLRLEDQNDQALVEVMADRALVWTTFRDANGDLVIELPNSRPAKEVEDIVPTRGLIAAIDVELFDDIDRPLTRLIVRTREQTEHSLTGEAGVLRLELLPIGGQRLAKAELAGTRGSGSGIQQQSPQESHLQYEPLSDDADLLSGREANVEVFGESGGSADTDSYGTPEIPVTSPPPMGVAATQLYSVEILDRDHGTMVRVVGDGEFAYSTFRLENPARFVLDLSGVVNASSVSTVPVASSEIEQIRIGQFKPRPDPVSRVVFDLLAQVPPSIERSADGLIISFGAVGSISTGATADGEEITSTEALASDPSSVEHQFEPVEEELAAYEQPVQPDVMPEESIETPAETSMEPSAAATVVAFDETTEPPPQVEEVAPPFNPPSAVPVYEPAASEDDAAAQYAKTEPFVASERGAVERADVALYEAQLVNIDPPPLEPEPVFSQLDALVVNRRQRQYVGDPVSMSLKQADLVETLRSFAKISDLNFVIQPGVGGTVTVELKSVPWDQAMEQILKINNLGMDIDGTIVRIAPMNKLRTEAEEERKLLAAKQQSIPLQLVMRSLSYAQANEVATLLHNRSGSILSSRGTVQVDNRTNTLILRELPGNINNVLAVIDNLDTAPAQVTIEARIVEATKNFGRSLGIQWGYSAVADQEHGNTTGLIFPNTVDSVGGVELLTGGATGFLEMTLGNILDTFNLDARLQAAENEGLINVVSAPRVTTLNNEPASIQSGLQIPIQTVTNRTVSVQFVNATLQLQVTPQVTAEGTVQLEINVAKREPQLAFAIAGATNAPIATKEARTKVIVRDGGTAVIGGIYAVSSNQNQDRVPGLANIPFLGHLFKNRNRSETNDELMIFITPRIVQM